MMPAEDEGTISRYWEAFKEPYRHLGIWVIAAAWFPVAFFFDYVTGLVGMSICVLAYLSRGGRGL